VRCAFLTGLVGVGLAAPLVVEAQPPEKLHRIGMVERTSIGINAANVDGLRHGLRELGYVEGRSFVIEYRSAEGRDQRFPDLATELARLPVDLILTRGTPAALAAKNATGTIPVVIVGVGDPVGQGLVASLAHPGGNVTGLSAAVTEIYPKRQCRHPAAVRRAHRRARHAHAGDQWVIVDLAAKHRLPAIYASSELARGLVAYGVNYPEMYRRAASFAHKIFKGAKPADLPAEEPTKFELVINLKTARALDSAVTPAAGGSCDRVIR
jgi:ABC-type uncharacterized transport system substrate-binding protein